VITYSFIGVDLTLIIGVFINKSHLFYQLNALTLALDKLSIRYYGNQVMLEE
jgi:hypothetical protein